MFHAFFRTMGNGKWKAQFYSAWPKDRMPKDDMQADRTLSMWANPSYNRIKKPQTYLYGMSVSLYPFKFQKPGLFTGK